MLSFCDRIGRSRRHVGNTDGILVRDLQRRRSSLSAVAGRQDVAVVSKVVAVLIPGRRLSNIIAIRIVIVVSVHAVPRDL